MGLSTILDVVIGVVFIFFVFSLVASGVHELVSRALASRSKQLWRAIGRLIDDDEGTTSSVRRTRTIVGGLNGSRDPRPDRGGSAGSSRRSDQLLAHALIGGLDEADTWGRQAKTRISHIEPELFSRALIDVVAGNATLEDTAAFRRALGTLPDGRLRRELEAVARHAGPGIDDLRRDLAAWFDDRMDALSTAYRRRTRWWLFVLGVVVAVGFNVDAVDVTNAFYRNEATRALVVAEAEALAAGDLCDVDDAGDVSEDCRDRLAATADNLDLPVWWEDGFDLDGGRSLIGWLIGGAAIAQGGPFWFDVLRRLAGFRRSALVT